MTKPENLNEEILNSKFSIEKQSRGEKRTLKVLENFEYKKIEQVAKVKIEKKRQIWIINNPEIFQSLKHGSLLVFGEAKIGRETSL